MPIGAEPAANLARRSTVRAASVLRALVLCAVILLILSAQAASATAPSDDFNRANGGLGSSWVAMSDGALSIASQAVVGTSATAGAIRVAETYTSDQSSQIQLTSTKLSGGQWVGPAVRAQNGGQDTYLGIYFWNSGSQQLRLYKRNAGVWIQLGSSYNSGPLPAGTTLQLSATGSTISFLQNGVARITATDTSITGGAPGIMTYGKAKADNWVGAGATGGSGSTYAVGGSTSGLSGTVVLRNNGGDDLTLNANGPFTFASKLASGTAYNVTVKTNPGGQTCSVANGSGTIGSADVSNVAVSCTANPTYAVGGSVTGLSGAVVLQDNGGDDLTLNGNGPFNFATKLASGSAYAVTVKTNPSGQSCSVANGSGTIGSADVTNVAITCTANPTHAVGGNVTGLSGTVVLQDNGGDDLTLNANGPFAFATKLASGTAYNVTVKTNPSGQTCSVANGSGTIGSADVSNVAVSCTSNPTYQVGGTVTGLSGSLVLQDNGGDDLTLNANGAFAFASKLASGSAYAVTVKTNPSGQTCSVANGSGTIGSADVTNVAVSCTAGTGNDGFSATYRGTDANGVASYDVTSPDDGPGTQTLRVLAPTRPAAGVPHSFLYLLPVEAGLGAVYGDGMATLQALDAQDQYNLTIIEPSFGIEPWYADNPNDPNLHYETFMTQDLVPWVTQNLSTTGQEQNWLLGFSKSGLGGQDLLLKHPDVFTLAASWDFPADMSSYSQFGGSSSTQYGTDANFQANYRLTPIFLEGHKLSFTSSNRIWIGGYEAFQSDMSDYDALLTSEGIPHSTETPTFMAHRWDSGWVPIALAALRQDSQSLTSP